MSNVPMTRPEEMLVEHKTAYFHSSTFVELDDGRILRHAYAEFTTSEDGGITWSEPFQRRDADGNLVDGHALVKLSGDGIGLVGKMGKPPAAPYGETRDQKTKRQNASRAARVKGKSPYLVFWRSDDDGETWQPPVRIATNGVGSYHNSIVRTASGRLLMPVEYAIGQRHGFDPSKKPTTGRVVDGQFLGVSGHYFDPTFGARLLGPLRRRGADLGPKRGRRPDHHARLEHDVQLRLRAHAHRGLSRYFLDGDADRVGPNIPGVVPRRRSKPESTEGGRRVSILKWPEGALLNLG